MGTSTATKTVSWDVSGAFITEQSRDFVLEKRWNYALKFLVDCVHGMTYDIAVSILSGKEKLTGTDRERNIDLAPEDIEVMQAYQKKLKWHYGGIYRSKEIYYRPYAYVLGYGHEDLPGGVGHGRKGRSRLDRRDWGADGVDWWDARGLHYANDYDNDIIVTPSIEIQKKVVECDPIRILLKQVSFPPFWVDTHIKIGDAIQEYMDVDGYLDARGHSFWYKKSLVLVPDEDAVIKKELGLDELEKDEELRKLEEIEKKTAEEEKLRKLRELEELDRKNAEEDAAYEKVLTGLGEEVREQAGAYIYGKKYGFFDLKLSDGRKYSIPYPPFENWALSNTGGRHLAIPWNTVCDSGVKMTNDNPFHSDWVLGTEPSIDFSKLYGFGKDELLVEAIEEKASEIQTEKLEFEMYVLSGEGEHFFEKEVLHPEPGEEVPEGSVIVLPSLNAKYINAMLSACPGNDNDGAIISEQGGEGSHLVMVGKKTNVNIAIIKNARKLYPAGSKVSINFKLGKINLSSFIC